VTARPVFVGALPVPVTGQTKANEGLIRWLTRNVGAIHVVRTTRGVKGCQALQNLVKVSRYIRSWIEIVLSTREGRSAPPFVYVSMESALGRHLSYATALLALTRGVDRVVLHFHSRDALRNPSPLLARILARGSQVEVVVLCSSAVEEATQHLGFVPSQIRVVSNAVFVREETTALQPGFSTSRPTTSRTTQVGYFSRVSYLKGADRMQRLASTLPTELHRAVAVKAAGSPGDVVFNAPIEYLGEITGIDRFRFLAGIDLLLFPSVHPGEFEPLAVLEALSIGTPVVASRIGCIPSLLPAEWTLDPDATDSEWCRVIAFCLGQHPTERLELAKACFDAQTAASDTNLRHLVGRRDA